jgi:hypothetical protein
MTPMLMPKMLLLLPMLTLKMHLASKSEAAQLLLLRAACEQSTQAELCHWQHLAQK